MLCEISQRIAENFATMVNILISLDKNEILHKDIDNIQSL